MELTILMPCLNEAETLANCIRKAKGFLETSGVDGEVLIADNGSTDGSQAIAENAGARVVHVADRGYGAALNGGIAAARGTYIIMGDADDSYDFSKLMPFVERLRAGADLVMGNRFEGGIAPGAMPVLHKYLGNPVLSLIGKTFFNISANDFHCGLRGFSAERIRSLGLHSTGMEFASEMVVSSALAGYRIDEVPTTLTEDGRSRPPHLKTWRDGWRHLKFLLMYSPRWLFVYPGLVLLFGGTTLGTLLFFGPIRIHQIVFDISSFFVACFMCVFGAQLLTTGMIARQYATMSGYLPSSRRIEAVDQWLTTDRLALSAVGIVLIGLILFVSAVWSWGQASFGNLGGSYVPRIVVAGLTIIVIGLQQLMAAFLVGILKIPYTK